MDEITLVNLLNKICEKNRELTWKLRCKYHDGIDTSIMQIQLLRGEAQVETSSITFRMETGQVIYGKHFGLVPFRKTMNLVDALLDILIYERNKRTLSSN